MILFTILLVMLLLFSLGAIFILIASGGAFILVFGDAIICIGLLIIIIKHFVKRKK